MRKIEKETLFGGIFGGIAIVAIIAEMILGGFSAEAIAGGIKDIAGTIVAVLVFIFAVRQFKKKNVKGFDETFNAEMQKIIVKYAPIIVAAEPEDGTYKDTMRFNLAAKLDSISTNDHGAYYMFFRAQHKQVPAVSFKVTKTVFGDRKETVAARIKGKVESLFSDDIAEVATAGDEVKITFNRTLETDEDAVMLAQIVDCVLLLSVAEYRKES